MARIAGVNLDPKKNLFSALPFIYGIGKKNFKDVCQKANLDVQRRVNSLTEQEILRLREILDTEYKVEGDLRREVAMDKKRLMDLGCYRGQRHRKNLPVRGQRTHTNARTRRGKAKAIAGKKG